MKRHLCVGAIAVGIAMTLVPGCASSDSVSQTEKVDKQAGIAAPGIAETKAIGEEGFIYGLPIVMNYAVMYEYCVDAAVDPAAG